MEQGLREAMAEEDRPSLVILRSHIGYPSPKFTDTPEAHGAPLGADEVAKVKEILGLPADQTFWVPDEVAAFYAEAGRRGAAERAAWSERLQAAVRASDARSGRGIGRLPGRAGPRRVGGQAAHLAGGRTGAPPGWPAPTCSTPWPVWFPACSAAAPT